MPAPAMTTSKCPVLSAAAARICCRTFISRSFLFSCSFLFCLPRCEAAPPSHLSSAEEGEALKQMHVLLVLQQRAVQRRGPLSSFALPPPFSRAVFFGREPSPFPQLRRRGVFS